MWSECPICFEALFDGEGICPDEEGVADTACHHVVHVRCLRACCAKVTDDDEEDDPLFGSGAYGCPCCQRNLTIIKSSREATFFPGFWGAPIASTFRHVGSSKVTVSQVKDAVRPHLTPSQLKHLEAPNDEGFQRALRRGGREFFFPHAKIPGLSSQGWWDYDEVNEVLSLGDDRSFM